MSYKLEWEDKGLLIRYSDTLSTNDLIKSNSEFIGNPNIETVKYIISDLSNVKDVNINETDVEITKDFAVRSNPINPTAKVAIVSANKELINLIESFILKSTAEIQHANYKHFFHINEAKKWATS